MGATASRSLWEGENALLAAILGEESFGDQPEASAMPRIRVFDSSRKFGIVAATSAVRRKLSFEA